MSKHCTDELGKVLYEEKLKQTEKTELILNFLKIFNKGLNYIANEQIIVNKESFDKNIDFLKTKDAIFNVKEINSFDYNIEYLRFMKEVLTEVEKKNKENGVNNTNYNLAKLIVDKDQIGFTERQTIGKDLSLSQELYLTTKNFELLPCMTYNKKLFLSPSYTESSYINENIEELKKSKNMLIIGADLGYLEFLLKDCDIENLYILEDNTELLDYLVDNVYKYLPINYSLHLINDIKDVCHDLDTVLLNPILSSELAIKKFYEYSGMFEEIIVPEKDYILLKFRLLFTDIVFSDLQTCIDNVLENYSDFYGVDDTLSALEIDFYEKVDRYLTENKVFFDTYKKYQKYVNSDENIINIINKIYRN